MAKRRGPPRRQIAFYGSTPAYLPVLELHGWGELGVELNRLSKQGEWVKMGELIDDEMLEAFAVVAPLDEVPARVVRALRRRRRPLQLLHPLPGRPGALPGTAGRLPRPLTRRAQGQRAAPARASSPSARPSRNTEASAWRG